MEIETKVEWKSTWLNNQHLNRNQKSKSPRQFTAGIQRAKFPFNSQMEWIV